MVCENSRRQYLIVFDSFARSLIAKAEDGDKPYRVDRVRQVGDGYVIEGMAASGGPAFRALIGGQRLIQLFVSGKVIQTDYCR